MNKHIAICLTLVVCLQSSPALAQHPECDDPVQAPFGRDGSWNVYQACRMDLQWAAAHQQAIESDFLGTPAALASIHSAAENRFVHGLGGTENHVWIGLTDRFGVSPGAQEGTFVWTSEEPVTYANWRRSQPSDSSGREDGVHLFRNDSNWNDDESGYALNEPAADPQSGNETLGKKYASVIEFNTHAAAPFPDIDAFYATLPRERLDGPAGTAGNWAVIDYYGDLGVAGPVTDVVDLLLGIQTQQVPAQSATAQLPTLTVADPDNPGAKSPDLSLDFGAGLFPYPSNDLTSATADDDNLISVAHGRLKPQEDGIYTIKVQSSEGFALRVKGAPVLNVAGTGTSDAFGPGTFMHPEDTINSSVRATFDLKADQEYDVEFLTWERDGGAFFEVVSQLGDEINDPSINPQWIALGDPETREAVEFMPTARLTGPLHVVNVNRLEEFDQAIEFARDIVLDNRDDPDAESNDATRFQFDDSNRDPKGCPFGQFNHDGNPEQWPNTSGNRDDFASGVFGSLRVDDGDQNPDETIEVSFYVSSDDRSSFRIVGQDFQSAVNSELIELDGDDSLVADQLGCENRLIGVISLTEGVEYEFEGIHVERTGDAGMQVLAALGNHVESFNPAEFTLLQLDPIQLSRNVGMRLVAETDGIVGDYNDNGQLDAEDLDLQATAIANNDLAFDLNGDGSVSVADRLMWVNDLKRTWMGDANLDGEFNTTDLVAVFQSSLFETGRSATWSQGDWNGDQLFTTGDLVVAFQGAGFELGPRAGNASHAVPEPHAMVLVLFGVLLVGARSVRRQAPSVH